MYSYQMSERLEMTFELLENYKDFRDLGTTYAQQKKENHVIVFL